MSCLLFQTPSHQMSQDWAEDKGYCRNCAGRCVVCERTKLKEEFGDSVWSNARKHGRPLRCSACPRNPHICGACQQVKPSSEFNKPSLNHAQSRGNDACKRCSDCYNAQQSRRQ